MKKQIFVILTIFIFRISFANDGAYFTSGNHLIPMYETSISCKKEILSIKRIENNYVKITVYYEFFNPGEGKTVEVGFEAASPTGDVNGMPKNGKHPYIYDFTVNLNNKILPYKVAVVKDSIYYKDGNFIEKDLDENDDGNYVNFNYVYHFSAHFIKGINIITHTYTFDLAGGLDIYYYLDYVLTAANRWSNKQIDDFTLLIDMGNFEDFHISKTFFKENNEWKLLGMGKIKNSNDSTYITRGKSSARFIIKDGFIMFQKMNFRPKGELYLYSDNPLSFVEANQKFDYKEYLTPFSIEMSTVILKAKDETSLKILRNLPYARRGYIFISPEIQKYYESMDWYIADPNYEAELDKLTVEELEWLKKIGLE